MLLGDVYNASLDLKDKFGCHTDVEAAAVAHWLDTTSNGNN
jgi:hypothetical protein